MAETRIPLTSRPLDFLYFTFFLIHILASIVVDLQSLYPPRFVPDAFRKLLEFYIKISNDPLTLGLNGNSSNFVWFKSFVYLEALFQVPVFILGMRGLWKNSRSIYVLLLTYAASTTTTTLACLAVILTTPVSTAESVSTGAAMITPSQRFMLLSSYTPFFIVPLIMTVDMAIRLHCLVRASTKADKVE